MNQQETLVSSRINSIEFAAKFFNLILHFSKVEYGKCLINIFDIPKSPTVIKPMTRFISDTRPSYCWHQEGLNRHVCRHDSRPGDICGLSLLLVLSLLLEVFSPGTPVFPSPQKPTFSNSKFQLDLESVHNKHSRARTLTLK